MIRRAVGILGAVCIVLAILLAIIVFGVGLWASRAATAPLAAGPAATASVAGPYAPAMSTGVYAQNPFLAARAALVDERTLTYAITTRFTERLAIGFDRPVASCDVRQAAAGRALHIFPFATVPGYAAVAFFSYRERTAAATTVRCTLREPVSALRTDGAALAAIDPIIAHTRLEYATREALLHSPRAPYPAHDPALRRMPLETASEGTR